MESQIHNTNAILLFSPEFCNYESQALFKFFFNWAKDLYSINNFKGKEFKE